MFAIDLDECLLTDKEVMVILDRAPRNVSKLSLQYNMIGWQACKRVAALHGLTSINLGGNIIGNEGVAVLAGMVDQLRELMISNLLGVTSFDPLVRALAKNRTVEKLDISDNVVKVDELKLLMTREVKFRSLDVSNIVNIFPRDMCNILSRQASGIIELYLDGLTLHGVWPANMYSHLKVLSILGASVDKCFATSISNSNITDLYTSDQTITLPSSLKRLLYSR